MCSRIESADDVMGSEWVSSHFEKTWRSNSFFTTRRYVRRLSRSGLMRVMMTHSHTRDDTDCFMKTMRV